MNVNLNETQKQLKVILKSNIAKAWYQLDKKSYEHWLEGRRISKSKLNI